MRSPLNSGIFKNALVILRRDYEPYIVRFLLIMHLIHRNSYSPRLGISGKKVPSFKSSWTT